MTSFYESTDFSDLLCGYVVDMPWAEHDPSAMLAIGAALTEFFACVRMVEALGRTTSLATEFNERGHSIYRLNRRCQRAESETCRARREAIGQRKRADWWRSEAKRLGWTDRNIQDVGIMEDRIHRDTGVTRAAKSMRVASEVKEVKEVER